MRVLVIGGSGYLGKRIVQRLAERGDDVTAVSRGRLATTMPDRVRRLHLDRQDRPAFEAAFQAEHFDAVIDIIAYDAEDIASSVRAFGGRVQQYILTSTMAAYHDAFRLAPLREEDADLRYIPTPDDPADTALHPTLGHAYGIGKRQAELKLLELEASVFNMTILRPPIVVGPDDRTRRVWWFVQRLLDGGPFVISDWGPGRLFQVVYADDLAAAYVAATGNPVAFGRTYNVAQPEIFTPETWIEALARALGREASWAHIPESLLSAVGLGEYKMPIAGKPFGHFLMDISRARQDLAFEPTPADRWLEATARGCAESPPTQDSASYDRRPTEVGVARRLLALEAEHWQHVVEEGQ